MCDFRNLEQDVLDWAYNLNILSEGTQLAQADKTLEEAQEIKDAIMQSDPSELKDALGDTFVTLIIQAYLSDLDLLESLVYAFSEIKDRTGKMQNGQFVKD